MSRGIPVRNAQGQIVDVVSPELFATTNLIDEAEPFATASPPAPDGSVSPSPPHTATPRRRTGETPTIFQLRPSTPTASSGARSLLQEAMYLIVGMSIVGLLILGVWSWRMQTSEATHVAPITDLTSTKTTPGVPTATLVMPTIPVAAVAYDAPGGVVLGAIEPGRRCTPLTWSADRAWLSAECDQSGRVWFTAAVWHDVPGLPPTPSPTATPLPVPTPVPTQSARTPLFGPTPTIDWQSRPIVGRAESPDGILICESRISQQAAEHCLADLLTQTAQAER
jgi:hypothetical protein